MCVVLPGYWKRFMLADRFVSRGVRSRSYIVEDESSSCAGTFSYVNGSFVCVVRDDGEDFAS